jgi:hypothetical protein
MPVLVQVSNLIRFFSEVFSKCNSETLKGALGACLWSSISSQFFFGTLFLFENGIFYHLRNGLSFL